jgi:hypothetical protein
MTRRNRKKKTVNGFLLPTPITTVVVVVSAVALAYIWLGCQCEAVGRTIKGLESEQLALREQLSNEQAKWAELKWIPNLEAALQRHGLAMQAPRPGQVVRLHGKFYEGWVNRSPDAARVARLHSGFAHE